MTLEINYWCQFPNKLQTLQLCLMCHPWSSGSDSALVRFSSEIHLCRNCDCNVVRHNLSQSAARTSTYSGHNFDGRTCLKGLCCSSVVAAN